MKMIKENNMELNNILNNLREKQRVLIVIKNKLQENYLKQLSSLNEEIDNIEDTIRMINKTTKELICPKCNGTGEERYCDAAGDMDDRECSLCHGTGISKMLKEEN